MVKDLTVGKPSNVLWRFCLPMFGSIVFQQLYNIADSLVAGQFIGENALAGLKNMPPACFFRHYVTAALFKSRYDDKNCGNSKSYSHNFGRSIGIRIIYFSYFSSLWQSLFAF